MDFTIPVSKWSGTIRNVTVGTGDHRLTIGGENTLPWHHFEGRIPNKPVIALEIQDIYPSDWPVTLIEAYGDCLKDPVEWATTAVQKYQAEMLCLNLRGTHPDRENRGVQETAELVKAISAAVDVPLIIQGPGASEKQNDVLNKCGEATAGKGYLLASAVQDNYKTITATCQAYGHYLVAESPIDVNLAKQLNILISDMSFPLDRIIIDPMTGALGYGAEYTYSVMERIRLAALSGDGMLQMPFICFVGKEVWRIKEVKVPESDQPLWGDMRKRGINWETATAVALILAGANMLVMRHPEAVQSVRTTIDGFMKQ